ncbi:hypothetical protein HOI26_03535 [Candidatus Woesearchaeota archaeon]|jgi:hypothetical protein|nr:hypothetical protein [Candidatus Woesearchaeota archaeon]
MKNLEYFGFRPGTANLFLFRHDVDTDLKDKLIATYSNSSLKVIGLHGPREYDEIPRMNPNGETILYLVNVKEEGNRGFPKLKDMNKNLERLLSPFDMVFAQEPIDLKRGDGFYVKVDGRIVPEFSNKPS